MEQAQQAASQQQSGNTTQQQQQKQAAMAAAMFNPAHALQAHAAAVHANNALDIEAKARSLLNFDYPVKRKNFDHINDRELRKKLKNRESAQIARERAKAKMIQLERMVAELSEANRILEFENHRLKSRLCQLNGVRPNIQANNWSQQMQANQHPAWSTIMAQHQRQQAQQNNNTNSASQSSSNTNSSTSSPSSASNSNFQKTVNPNDPACTQGTMTVKCEPQDHHNHLDHDQPPHKRFHLDSTQDTSSGASSGHRSESSDTSNSGHGPQSPLKHIKEEALNHTAHLLGIELLSGVNSSSSNTNTATTAKGDSGNESDGNGKNLFDKSSNGSFSPEPDFNKIITDLKTGHGMEEHDLNNVTATVLGDKSSDAIFKDLINSLPI